MKTIITNKQDLFLWLEKMGTYIEIDKLPEVKPHIQPIKNSKWEEIDTDLSDTEYYFKLKTDSHYGIDRCVIWLDKNIKEIKIFLVRPSPKFTKYGKIKARFIDINKEQELLSSKENFENYIKLLFSEFDFKY